MAAAKNRQPDTTPYGIGRLVGITYRKVQVSLSLMFLNILQLVRTFAPTAFKKKTKRNCGMCQGSEIK